MTNSSNANTRIAKNTVFLTIRMLLVLVISLYSSRLVLQVLGVEDFGIYNVVGGFVSMFGFLNSSMTNSIQRYYNYSLGHEGENAISKVYYAALVIQVILALIVLLLVESVGLWYLYNKMVIPVERMSAAFWVFQFSVISMLFVIMQVPYASAVMAYEKMNFFAVISVLDAVLKLVAVLLIPSFGGDHLIWYGFLILFISILDFCLYLIYSKRNFKYLKIERVRDKTLYKGMLSFSGWNLFGTFALMMKEQGLNMVLNLFFGPVVNAARGVAYQVINAIRGFTSNIYTAARPQFTQSYAQGDSKRTIQLMFSTSKLCFILLLIFSLPVMIEAEYVLRLWLGENVPDYTVIFVILVIVSSLITVFNPAMSFVVHATGNMKTYQIAGALIDLLILPTAYVFLKMGYQPESVFIISIAFNIIQQIVSLVIVKRLIYFSIRDYVMTVWLPLGLVVSIVAALSFGVHSLMPQGFIRLCVVVVVSSMLSIGLSYVVALSSSERLIFNNFVNKVLKKGHSVE